MATFSNLVLNVTAQTPSVLGYTLSSNGFKVSMDTLNATVCAKKVVGILFNGITNPVTNLVTLTAGTVQFKVSRSYHGSTMALYFADRSTTLFTCNTALTTGQVLSAIGFGNRGPEEKRKHNLGYF